MGLRRAIAARHAQMALAVCSCNGQHGWQCVAGHTGAASNPLHPQQAGMDTALHPATYGTIQAHLPAGSEDSCVSCSDPVVQPGLQASTLACARTWLFWPATGAWACCHKLHSVFGQAPLGRGAAAVGQTSFWPMRWSSRVARAVFDGALSIAVRFPLSAPEVRAAGPHERCSCPGALMSQ